MLLKGEEKSLIIELSEHPGFRALVNHMGALVQLQEKQLLDRPLMPGQEDELLYDKARVEGARRLVSDLKRSVEKLRTKK